MSIIVYWGLYWGPPILGNKQLLLTMLTQEDSADVTSRNWNLSMWQLRPREKYTHKILNLKHPRILTGGS